jgi:cytoskeletal protein CcmA (bactofilin family)
MSEPITIIGTNTVVSGNLEGDEDLTVEGRVEGSITLSHTLSIEVGGVVRANVHVRNAVISGVLVGNVEAQESVHITEAGRVVGDIVAPRVILVDGASFRGNIDMGSFDIDRDVKGAPARKPMPRTQAATAEAAPEAAAPAPRPAPARPQAAPRPAVAPAPRPAAPPAMMKAAPEKKAPPPPKGRVVGKAKAVKKSR